MAGYESERPAVPKVLGALELVGANETRYFSRLSRSGSTYYQTVPQAIGASTPRFEGNVEEFRKAHPDLLDQLQNVGKRCARCSKTCAAILPFCNGCGQCLKHATLEYTENVCMGFVYGARDSSRGPLTLSMRWESADLMVYDDLLARGTCHLNAIPCDCHVPDWRHLLRNPAKAIAMLRRMDDACWKVFHEQFWCDEKWRATNLREGAFETAEDFRREIYAGINSVPSQFQIHIQYIVPPISPSDYHNFLQGRRFMKNRWLPLDFVYETLETLDKKRAEPSAAFAEKAFLMDQEDIFAAIANMGGPVYEEVYAQTIRRYNKTHRRCANWRSEHFELEVVVRHPDLRPELIGVAADSDPSLEGNAQSIEFRPLHAGVEVDGVTAPALEKADKIGLQSYGRPFHDGKPLSKSYYSHARAPGDVLSVDEWAKS
eukprot:TRINITY_DN16066_c0_g2_i1.p1 TRINITY_DN16066_c0_g2~~TRINITY_DN16066_c0_g2_i1.p1  ORF type:complete len:431 (-),score=53.87 TRINITY_DN16066_c0_g2_i1:125-1417(-)